MICKKCGRSIPERAEKCPYCGKRTPRGWEKKKEQVLAPVTSLFKKKKR